MQAKNKDRCMKYCDIEQLWSKQEHKMSSGWMRLKKDK